MKCYNVGCNKKPTHKVEKKIDLRHRAGYYCDDCVELYRDSEEGKTHFNVVVINGVAGK